MTATALPPLRDITSTRTTLHWIAENVLAAQQYAANEQLALTSTPHGFATGWFPADGADLRIRVEGDQVIRETTGQDTREPIRGEFDPDAAELLYAWWGLGQEVLTRMEAGAGESISPVVLWPEHFDIAVTLTRPDARAINLGFSPGDEFSAQPYVYAGPWEVPTGDFWNAPFGAYRTYEQIAGGDPFATADDFLAAARAEFS
ncbi:MAG TPA: hypothetical protein VGN35_06895 [Jatrophihabitantaceae bacterium]|jgi:hypothetical protein|nr:hypothetical protein [Jatrophihabitantaceae bacterium]